MCGCEPSYVCSRCRDTWLADGYELEPVPETVWEQLDREASHANQPAEFIGGAR